MIAVVDYGVGNLFSLVCSVRSLGVEVAVERDPEKLSLASSILLPGVGAFEDAAKLLASTGMGDAVKEQACAGKPVMGICLGMQLLFDRSFEYGDHAGLGLIKGEIVPLEPVIPANYKIPHIGWNALHFPKDREKSELFKYIDEGDFVYFVHSYYAANCSESVIATTEYGAEVTAAAASENVYGCQFHPEKSGDVGLKILRAFCEL